MKTKNTLFGFAPLLLGGLLSVFTCTRTPPVYEHTDETIVSDDIALVKICYVRNTTTEMYTMLCTVKNAGTSTFNHNEVSVQAYAYSGSGGRFSFGGSIIPSGGDNKLSPGETVDFKFSVSHKDEIYALTGYADVLPKVDVDKSNNFKEGTKCN